MGGVVDQPDAAPYEYPVQSVFVDSFYMGTTEVTWSQWQTVYSWATQNGYTFLDRDPRWGGYYPIDSKGSDHPVHNVPWYDAIKWCNARSEMEGKKPCYYIDTDRTTIYRTGLVDLVSGNVRWEANGYRLPTEAEWERAARGGLVGFRYPWGTNEISLSQADYQSFGSSFGNQSPDGRIPDYQSYPYTAPVFTFAPNAYGLYGMAGNANEWCWDIYAPYTGTASRNPTGPLTGASLGTGHPARTVRSGSGWGPQYALTCAARDDEEPFWQWSMSFRLVYRGNPLVFIPGIAGSELRDGVGGTHRWPTVHSDDIDQLNLQTGAPGIVATDIVRYGVGFDGVTGRDNLLTNIYALFINDLTTNRNYIEYQLNGIPGRMTGAFQGSTQNLSPRPNLFCFPYDWRKSNTDHLDTLHAYINNISSLHGGAKVNIVTHSMGGLLFRAYMLKYKNENKINNVVTVNLPFWGAPMAFYRMLAGEFYETVPIVGSVLDYFTDAAQKRALPTFPAFHQLLPSDYYLNAVDNILSEEGWDFDGNHIDNEVYDSTKLKEQINLKSGQTVPPYSTNMAFHTLGQDDWSGDDSSINMLHLITKKAAKDTTVGLKFVSHTFSVHDEFGFIHDLKSTPVIQKVPGFGDGVVPFLSANRNGGYNGPSASYHVVPTTDDAKAEHTAALENKDVWDTIDDFLSDGKLNTSTPLAAQPPAAPTAPATGRKKLEIYGASYVHITDDAGNQNTPVGDIAALKIPDVDIDYGGTSPWMTLDFAADKNLTILGDPGNPGVEIVSTERDSTDAIIAVTRYRLATGNHAWNLVVAGGQPPVVKLDADSSGTFDTNETVAPTKALSGPNIDTTPPSIGLSFSSVAGGGVTMSVTGADSSGTAPALRYSVNDGALQNYTSALSFSAGQTAGLKFFAEDASGNTSGLIQTTVHPTLQPTADTSGNIQLEWPISDGYVLEVSDDLVTWSTSPDPVTQSSTASSVSVSMGSNARKFYRLRSQQVNK